MNKSFMTNLVSALILLAGLLLGDNEYAAMLTMVAYLHYLAH